MTVLLLFSSPHSFSTGFRSEDFEWPSEPIFGVWIILWLEDPNMAHYKISNRVSHLLIFYLLVFDRIHNAMCLNKMSRTSIRNIGTQNKKIQQYISFYTYFFIPVFTKPILSFVAKKQFVLVSSDHRSQSHLKFQSCLITEYAGVCFWMSLDNFSWNPPKQHVVVRPLKLSLSPCIMTI